MNKMIPSEVIHSDENGNVVIDGSTKLNGGLKPIHDYRIKANPTGYHLIVLFEEYDETNQTYCAFGFIRYEGDSIYPGVFHYSLVNGEVDQFYGVFEDMVYDCNGSTVTVSQIATNVVP